MMIRQRVRIRFRKEGDLRLISHRDLVRTFERLFRRVRLPLSMSEGFHPKPRMSFPSALSLGIAGCEEVAELELSEVVDADELRQSLSAEAPAGLAIVEVRLLAEGEGKAQLERVLYEIEIPPTRREATRQAIQRLLECPSYPIQRKDRSEPIDLLADLEVLKLVGERLHIGKRASRSASAQPREILAALDLADLEDEGRHLTRTQVEIA